MMVDVLSYYYLISCIVVLIRELANIYSPLQQLVQNLLQWPIYYLI